MQLTNARLCLDCEELHELEHCPVCGSESFAFVTRWVKPADGSGDGPPRPKRPDTSTERREQLDVYRQILSPDPAPSPTRGRSIARGALGLAALLGIARLAWRKDDDGS